MSTHEVRVRAAYMKGDESTEVEAIVTGDSSTHTLPTSEALTKLVGAVAWGLQTAVKGEEQ
jgi:hypothetical protein